MTASFKYAGMGAKMGQRRSGENKGYGNDDIDVGDTCIIM